MSDIELKTAHCQRSKIKTLFECHRIFLALVQAELSHRLRPVHRWFSPFDVGPTLESSDSARRYEPEVDWALIRISSEAFQNTSPGPVHRVRIVGHNLLTRRRENTEAQIVDLRALDSSWTTGSPRHMRSEALLRIKSDQQHCLCSELQSTIATAHGLSEPPSSIAHDFALC